jgi:hypothetical protein
MGGILTISPQQYAEVFKTLGVGVDPIYASANKDAKGAFTDRSYVFRIRGQGSAGAVVKNIEAIVSFEPNQAGVDAATLGRLLHWREE